MKAHFDIFLVGNLETVQPLCVLILTLWIIVLFSTFMTQPVKCAVAVGQSYHSFVNLLSDF